MNYETQVLSDSSVVLGDDDSRGGRKRLLIVGGIVALVLIAVAVWMSMRGGDAAAPAPAAQVPVVTVTSPGQSTIARTVTANGSLAARVDMPVGVIGEGGMVTRVLVQPGDGLGARGSAARDH